MKHITIPKLIGFGLVMLLTANLVHAKGDDFGSVVKMIEQF